jgi:hypothetical protein
MGTVIDFPNDRRTSMTGERMPMGPAHVIVLPVVRIERHADGTAIELPPEADSPSNGGRRRRGRRP